MSAIEFRNLCKRYAPAAPLTIRDANLSIEPGQFCVFVGPSGCGKSTLLRMVAGLEDITSGDLLLGGRRVNDLAPARRDVAMVFQSYALYPHMTVAQNMAFGLRVMGSDRVAIDRKVREVADILQLTPLLDRLPRHLSGGQRQRVAIGRALVKQPRVFLFDEPLSNLDAALRVQMRLEIARLHRHIGSASTIYVTHDQVEAMTLADRIVLLHTGDLIQSRGSVAQVGSPMDLYHRPASRFVAEFIGSPRMNIAQAQLLEAHADHAVIDAWGHRVTVHADARHLAAGAPVQIGVRPEHLPVQDEGAAGTAGTCLRAGVEHVERLGDCSLLYVRVTPADAAPLTVRLDGGQPVPARGDAVNLCLLPHQIHLFDAQGMACARTAAGLA